MQRSPLLALLTATLAPLAAQNLAPTAGRLLRDHPGAVDPIAHLDQSLAWSRPVDVDMDLLARLDPTGGSVVEIELRTGLAYRAVFERRVVHEFGGLSWIGSLEGLPDSRFFLSVADGHVAATFQPNTSDATLGAGVILNLMPGPGAHFVRAHLDDLNRCGNDDDAARAVGARQAMGRQLRPTGLPGNSGAQPASNGCCDEDPRRIDIHYVVTPLAIAQLGGGQEAAALVATSILTTDFLSTGHGSGGFAMTARKVGPVSTWAQVDVCDGLGSLLSSLRSDSNIAQLRDRYQADLVHALVADLGTNCHQGVAGRAYIGDGRDDRLGFGVDRATLAAQVVPHEVGHNLGCQHQSSSCSTYNNAWQMVCQGAVKQTRMWATLGSSVIGFFSNPDFIPNNCLPFGLANCADNARRIGETRQGIANFRGGHIASSANYGSGWAGSTGVPSLTATTRPEPGTTLTLRATNSRGGLTTSGVLLLGVQRENLPTPFGGSRLVNPLIQETIPLAPFRADTNLPLPADRNLCGTTWHTQVVMLDPGASAGLAFTPGLTLNLGR